ncbi:MAG: hypothetical protein WA996_15500 [Candidatus Promineifilaceae bacterium]
MLMVKSNLGSEVAHAITGHETTRMKKADYTDRPQEYPSTQWARLDTNRKRCPHRPSPDVNRNNEDRATYAILLEVESFNK